VHLLTKELYQLQAWDRTSEAPTKLATLQEQGGTLLAQVNLIIQESNTVM
jgi:hypothetical protein